MVVVSLGSSVRGAGVGGGGLYVSVCSLSA